MITIYRLFQIIMGIMLSGFIFYLLISYAGDYAGVGETATRFKTLDVFLQDSASVYLTGNNLNFSAFSRDDYSSCHAVTGPPRIACFIEESIQETKELRFPILMRPGNSLLLSRTGLDYGWASFGHVLALPRMRLVFNPLVNDEEHWGLVMDIAGAFPDTSGLSPKVTFDICNGTHLIMETLTGSSHEQHDFLLAISRDRTTASPCQATLPRTSILVTISSSCSQSFAGSGVCVQPSSSGVGRAWLAGHDREFVYKDPLDLAALVIGGTGRDVFGKPMGQGAFESRNEVFLSQLEAASMVMEERCSILKALPETREECRDAYQELEHSASALKGLSGSDPYSFSGMAALRSELELSRTIWQELLNRGCERHA